MKIPIARDLHHYGKVLLQDLMRSDLTTRSSAMAYITIFSLVPSLAAVFSLLSLFLPVLGNQAYLMDKARDFILENLASGSGDTVIDYLDQFLKNVDLKKIGITSFTFLFVSLIMLLRQIEGALNRIWFVVKARNAILRFIYFWTFLTLGTFLIAIVVGMSANFSHYTDAANIAVAAKSNPFFSFIMNWAMWIGFFFLIYKFIPNCYVSKRSALISACIGGSAIYLGNHLYGIYIRDFNNYKNIYGALAAIPIFLFWIYICWTIVLFGSLIGWRLQQGFPDQLDEDSVEIEKTPEDVLRNIYIKSALPMVVLFLVHRKFDEGSGQGVAHGDLVKNFRLPEHWIGDAVDSLIHLGYVIEGNPDEGIATARSKSYFPSIPAEKVKLDVVQNEMMEPFDRWFKALEEHAPKELIKALAPIQSMLKHNNSKSMTVAAILNRSE